MCLYSKGVRNPKYRPNKKNGGKAPVLRDKRFEFIPAKCGECPECRKEKARDWMVRIAEELKTNFGYFVTMTFSNESFKELENEFNTKMCEGYENAIATFGMRRFLERVRKDTGKSLKHWAVTELGEEKDRLHIHAIVFGQKSAEHCKKHWKYGNVYIGDYCNEKTVGYIVKYMNKLDMKHPKFKGIVLTSSGIGENYIKSYNAKVRNKFRGKDTNLTYKFKNGKEVKLPKYYIDKLYTDEEREQLWGYALDKGEIWVHGEKVRINNGNEKEKYKSWETIRNLTEYYRKKLNEANHENPEMWEKRKAFRMAIKEEIRGIKSARKTLKAAKRASCCARIMKIGDNWLCINIDSGEIIG